MTYRNLYAFLLALGAACYGQSTITIPFTGTGAGAQDPNWTVESHLSGEPGGGQATIVRATPPSWVTPDPGTGWIAPQADQSTATRSSSCCQGGVLYKVNINVPDTSTATLEFNIGAHKEVTVWLVRQCNPCTVGNDYDVPDIVYSEDNSTASNPVKVTIKQGASYRLSDGAINTVHFSPGANTIIVEVDNYIGGPTGLYIGPATSTAPAATGYTDAAPADWAVDALPDPIDSASGQFYDTEVDFRLGGPMELKFERWYGSQLLKSGVLSALGTNWMGTFDVAAFVKGTKAQVLLFGGRAVTFNNSAGAWQLASPLSRGYQFAAAGTGYQFFDPSARLIYTFTAAGVLTKIEDRNGNALLVTPDVNGPAKVTDGLGRTLSFAYAGGQLVSVQDQSGRTTTYTYAGGLLASVTDPGKAVSNYAYGAKGLLTKETLPLGNAPVTQIYDVTGRVTSQTDAGNNVSRLAYDTSGQTTITDAAAGVTRHKNDATGNVAQIVDATGGTTSLIYDGSHRLSSVTDKTGGTSQYLYHPQTGYLAAQIDQEGNTTTYSYTSRTMATFTFYDLTGITYADGSSASASFDAGGNQISETKPNGATLAFSYDAKGHLTSKTDSLGKTATYTWNADGTLGSESDALGNTTKFEYNSAKRLSKLTDPNGSSASYTYDSDGRLTTGARATGRQNWTTHFDANGQLDVVTNPLGAVSRFSYTPTGKVASLKDPLGNLTTYTYDTLDRLGKTQNGAGEVVTFNRDRAGRVISTSDGMGPRLTYEYDAEGRNTVVSDATGRAFRFGYDKAGRRTSIKIPGGGLTQFSYDSRANVISKTNALGDQRSFTYDAMNRLISVTGPDGSTTSFQRDAAGKPILFTSATGKQWSMTYDDAGRLSNLNDPQGNATNYVYKGTRVAEIDYPLGSVNFTYNAAGQRISADYSDGTVIKAGYNELGMITSGDGVNIQRNSIGLPTSMNGIGITTDAAGRPATLTYAPGKTITYVYDKAGRVSSVSDWTMAAGSARTVLAYDAGSRRTALTFPNGVSNTYGYNTDGRRNSITYGSAGSIALTLDAVGKVTSAERNLPISPTLQDDSTPLPQATYDSMGRVTAQGARSYGWNMATQMTSFSDPVNSAQITYDALNEIRSSTASGVQQTYVFNYAAKYPALQIVRQGGNDVRYFVYLPDGELLYSIEASTGTRWFYHFDEMGNTVFLTDDSGNVSDTYGITPYGEIADHLGTSDNPFTWQGQFGTIQEGSGLYYMRSRHYDAISARFLSPDPYMNAEPQASEPYAYARGNPLLYRDPFGTDASIPQDVGELYGRFSIDIGLSLYGYVDPQFAFLQIAVALVEANPDADFHSIIFLALLISQPALAEPAPAEIAPPVLQVPAGAVSTGLNAGAPIISQDGNSLIGQDGNGLHDQDPVGLIGQDGNALIGQDGNGLHDQNPVSLIGQDGNRVISRDGAGVVSNDGGTFIPRTSAFKTLSIPSANKPKNNKR